MQTETQVRNGALLRVRTGADRVQESYASASRDAGRRAREARALGCRVVVASLGFQIGPNCNVTLVEITGNVDALPTVPTTSH